MHFGQLKEVKCWIKLLIVLCLCLIVIIVYILQFLHEELPDYAIDEEMDEPWKNNELFNLHSFGYLLNSRPCSKDDFAVIIATSYAADVVTRSSLRRAYPFKLLQTLKMKMVFLLAIIDPDKGEEVTQEALVDEQKQYGDLIQGNFMEHYRNLTYKHIMGLRWASEHCSQAQYIIKMDHDIVVDNYSIVKMLKALPKRPTVLMGYEMTNMKPIREPANKWYVTPEEYAEATYPDFLSGWLYVTNPFTARLLCFASKTVPYFWIDDTYVTGMLARKLALRAVSLNSYYTTHPEHLQCCIAEPRLKCDYWVGPNGGDTRLVGQFQAFSERCHHSECTPRLRWNLVRDTCKVS